jgi:AraC-like DNA-binding protein
MPDVIKFRTGYRVWTSPPTPEVLSSGFAMLQRWEHDDLSAPFWRWYMNDRPGAFICVNKAEVELLPGRVYLIPPRTAFATWIAKGAGDVGHLHVHFALGLDHAAEGGPVFDFAAEAEDRRLARAAGEQMREGRAESEFALGFRVQALVNRTLARVPAEYWAGRSADDRMSRVLRRLKSGVAGGVDKALLAREAGLGRNAFGRFFREATGDTPHRYLTRLRVERACEQLRDEGATVDEIAAATGFCDRFHFTRVFKRHMGVGPAEYRRRHQEART